MTSDKAQGASGVMVAIPREGPQDIDQRSFQFAVRVLRMVGALPRTIATIEIGRQVVRSATSVNSNVVQARRGVSKADFINHMRIALKEADETVRWIEMLVAADFVHQERVTTLLDENHQIARVLTTIIRKAML